MSHNLVEGMAYLAVTLILILALFHIDWSPKLGLITAARYISPMRRFLWGDLFVALTIASVLAECKVATTMSALTALFFYGYYVYHYASLLVQYRQR